MTTHYNPQQIESKWQQRWAETRLYETEMDSADPERNFYNLTMYPYPSGNLHTGHWYAYTGPDVLGRYKRLRGYNVFFPFGYDAFGLPAENAAVKNNIHPATWTAENIAYMTTQIKRMGTSIDWRATLATCEPEYYRWNQWFFLKFMERGLAYREFAPVDWCPSCNTSLAREQVVGEARLCERCSTPVSKRDLDQWKFRITDYAEQLLADLDQLDWPPRVKRMQENWLGRSEGVTIRFPIAPADGGAPAGDAPTIEVFTTRADTLFGTTFMVLAPEHPLVDRVTTAAQQEAVAAYRAQAARQSEIERMSTVKQKTGVFTGGYVLNPLTHEPIPIWIADYAMMGYGTGAVMGVPGGDERDHQFATTFGLPIVTTTVPLNRPLAEGELYAGPGRMVNSGPLDGLLSLGKYRRETWGDAQASEYGFTLAPDAPEAKERILELLAERGAGEPTVNWRLRDWLVSRQRFWGTPIPVVYCDKDGIVPVPYDQLPVLLPMDVDFKPTGESPLRFHEGFRNTTCPRCGGPATRDTDTMDTFVDSSWYQYRYLSPHFDEGPFNVEGAAAWLPVDQYTGGVEHAVMHLLYTRFWTKVMRDMGMLSFDEPFPKLFSQGTILGPDSQKMSKSRGNVVDPDELVAQYGADVVRGYLMFIGPWDQGGPFSTTGVEGVSRFYQRLWTLMSEPAPGGSAAGDPAALERALHQTIGRVQEAYESFSFNVALAALMGFSNTLREASHSALVGQPLWDEALDALLIMLAPMAPHITEELWARRGKPYSIHQQQWPAYDAEKAREATFELVVQHNGKIRDRIEVAVGISEAEAQATAMASERLQAALGGREPKKVIYVPGRLINVVG